MLKSPTFFSSLQEHTAKLHHTHHGNSEDNAHQNGSDITTQRPAQAALPSAGGTVSYLDFVPTCVTITPSFDWVDILTMGYLLVNWIMLLLQAEQYELR